MQAPERNRPQREGSRQSLAGRRGREAACVEDVSENFRQDLPGRCGRIDGFDEGTRIAVQDAERFRFENGQPAADDLGRVIIGALFFGGTTPEALFQHGQICTAQVQDQHYVDEGCHHSRLGAVAWNAIEDEQLVVRLESRILDVIGQALLPKADGEFIRDQFSARRVVHEFASQR